METSLTLSLRKKKKKTLLLWLSELGLKREKPLPAVLVQTAQINYGVSGQSSQVVSN